MGGTLVSSTNWFLYISHIFWLLLLLFCGFCIQGAPQDPPTFASYSVRSGSWYQNSSRSPKDENDDDDSDEDDDDDDNERTNSVVVAAIPVVLGVLAIVLLCVFMMCRRTKIVKREAKWTARIRRASLTSARIDIPDEHDGTPYETVNYLAASAVTQETSIPSAPPDTGGDLPPSYEEVMRDLSRTNASAPQQVRQVSQTVS